MKFRGVRLVNYFVIKTYFPKDLSSDIIIADGKNQVNFSLNVANKKNLGKKTEYINLYGDKKEAIH